jgi:hypothetical protein
LVNRPRGFGGGEVADHVVEAGDVDRVAGSAGSDRQSDGDVCLVHPPGGPGRAALAFASTNGRVVRSLTLRGSSSGWKEKS